MKKIYTLDNINIKNYYINTFAKIIIVCILVIVTMLYKNTAYAADITRKLYQDIHINLDGSITVTEAALLDGKYNGREREIDFSNGSDLKFTGRDIDFSGKADIYNASGITDIKIYDISKEDFSTIDDMVKIEKVYREVESAELGDYGVYTVVYGRYGNDFRIYCPSNKKKVFVMEYKIKDAVVVHNDVAELYWNVLGDNYRENIEDFQVKIHLPGEDGDVRIWTHGPASGSNEIIDSKTLYFKDNNIFSGQSETVRVMFDKSLVPNATKKSGVDGKNYILRYEQLMANEKTAVNENKRINNIIFIEESLKDLRRKIDIYDYDRIQKRIYELENIDEKNNYQNELGKYKEAAYTIWKNEIEVAIEDISKNNYENLSKYSLERIKKDVNLELGIDSDVKEKYLNQIVVLEKILEEKKSDIRKKWTYSFIITFIIVIIIVLSKLVKHQNEKKRYSGKYYRDFPSDDNPYVIEYLIKREVTDLSFSTTLLNLIAKKAVKVTTKKSNGKEKIKFVIGDRKCPLTKAETVLVNTLFSTVGSDSGCYLDKLKSFGQTQKNAKVLMKRLDEFKEAAKEESDKKEYFKFRNKNIISGLIIVLFGIFSFIASFGMFYEMGNEFFKVLIFLAVMICLEIVFFKIVSLDKNRTEKGKIEYAKWMAHKRFLKDFSKINEKDLPDIVLWEKYLVTATILGVADKVEKRLKMHITEFNEEDYYLLSTLAFEASLTRLINSSVSSGFSVASSTVNSASSSGYGGGSSSFGGGGGGSGGGGRF